MLNKSSAQRSYSFLHYFHAAIRNRLYEKPKTCGVLYFRLTQVWLYIAGTARFSDDLQRYRETNLSNTFLTDWIQVFHGDYIHVNVKCVNNIDLSTIEVFGPIKVSLDRPLSKYARLSFISLSQLSTETSSSLAESPDRTDMVVQSDKNYLQFRWVGFFDASGIQSFEYRVLSQKGTYSDWFNTGLKDIATVENTFMNGKRYTIQVCAINMGTLRGDAISATMLVESRAPRLTGIIKTIKLKNKTLLHRYPVVTRII